MKYLNTLLLALILGICAFIFLWGPPQKCEKLQYAYENVIVVNQQTGEKIFANRVLLDEQNDRIVILDDNRSIGMCYSYIVPAEKWN